MSSAAEAIGGSTDILTEILSYLPIKLLLRLKSLNKQLHHLISLPSFSLLHSLRHPNHPPSALFFLHHSPSPSPSFLSLSSLSHPSPPTPPPLSILQSSHGLLLSSPSPDTLLILNPTTGHSVSLLRPNSAGVTLAFDPSRWTHYYLVTVFYIEGFGFNVSVYDSSTRRWGDAVEVVGFDLPFDLEFDRGVYWRGKVFWLSHTDSMVFYDLETEVVGRLGLPKAVEGAYMERFRYFGESCGHLHLIEIRTNCVQVFDVLELEEKDGGLEWFVKYRVDLDVLGCGFEDDMFQDHNDRFGRGFRFYAFSILAVVRGVSRVEDVLDANRNVDDESALVISIPGKVISYNFKTKVSKLLCNVVDQSDKWFPFRGYNAFPYIESLYCV